MTCPDITLTPATLPIGHAGEPYPVTLDAAGGLAPYTFAANGALPAGLSWTGATLSGTRPRPSTAR